MDLVLDTLGHLVMLIGRKAGEGRVFRAVDNMHFMAGFDAEPLDATGDTMKEFAPALHSGCKLNIAFLFVPSSVI